MSRRGLPRALAASAWLVLGASALAQAGGVSPYLPLNLSPEIEHKVEQVLILADAPVLTRPIPIARVLKALPKACERDAVLCRQVRRYLDRYFQSAGITEASGELTAASHSQLQLPNAHGEHANSPWDASVVAAYRPFDYALVTAGGVAYGGANGQSNPDGSLISVGDEYLQVDAGYRDQWLSPLTDSSMLIGTQAPTMPGLTISNQMPMGLLGWEYQISYTHLSYSDLIAWNGGETAGDPRLTTLHLGIHPLPGWSFAGNALYQFGGGVRPDSFRGFVDSLFGSTNITAGSVDSTDSRFANREISLTSAYTFPAKTPIETYVEYAGRDTLHGELYRFHDTALSAGIHLPELYRHFDLTVEGSEWQNNWYTDYVWQSGLVNDGSEIGNWGAAWRNFYDAAGARSGMVRLTDTLSSGDLLQLQYRVLQNAGYAASLQAVAGYPVVGYSLAEMATFEFAQPRDGYTRGVTLDVGRDEFAASFVRLSVFARLDGGNHDIESDADESEDEDSPSAETQAAASPGLERFVDVGASGGRLGLDLGGFSAASEAAPLQNQNVISPHLGVGLRRQISAHSDLGVRADLDDFHGLMAGLRILDYRYRIGAHLAIGGFAGFARYSGPTPAQGYYYGLGLQWRNVWRHWDVSLDERFFDALQRDKLLPSDQAAASNGDPVEWYSMQAPTLYLSHAF